MAASQRPKQAKHFLEGRKIEDGNITIHKGLSDSKGMGLLDTPFTDLPSHPYPHSFKEVPVVHSEVSNTSSSLPLWASDRFTSVHNHMK